MKAANLPRILFVCVHNSARSVMAEKFAQLYGGDRLLVTSAGFEPKTVLPLALEVMKERGLDISSHQPRDVYDLHGRGFSCDYVVLLCGDTHGHALPTFSGATVLNWHLPEPSCFTGSLKSRKENTRVVRNSIEKMVMFFVNDLQAEMTNI